MTRSHATLLALLATLSLACSAEPASNGAATAPDSTGTDLALNVVSGAPGTPLPGLTSNQLQAFNQGMAVFATNFTPTMGLGPLFNSTSCAACHDDPTLGGYGDSAEVHMSAYHGTSCSTLDSTGGPVVQQHTTPELFAAMNILKEPDLTGATGAGIRTTPVIFGLGMIDAVSDLTIRALARIRYPDGVHGRAAVLPNRRVGRFGRKASVASLAEFNAGAFFNEMGVTNPLNLVEGTVNGVPLPAGVDLGPDPEINAGSLAAADAFVRFLAPVAPLPATPQTRRGQFLFSAIRCTNCHIPTLTTGFSPIAALRFKRIAAYTDLLLHDMGPAEADICNGVATPSDFRTQPLMGMQFLDMFMHDGVSGTVDEAIQRHGGEGSAARARFQALTPTDQAALVAFVGSL